MHSSKPNQFSNTRRYPYRSQVGPPGGAAPRSLLSGQSQYWWTLTKWDLLTSTRQTRRKKWTARIKGMNIHETVITTCKVG